MAIANIPTPSYYSTYRPSNKSSQGCQMLYKNKRVNTECCIFLQQNDKSITITKSQFTTPKYALINLQIALKISIQFYYQNLYLTQFNFTIIFLQPQTNAHFLIDFYLQTQKNKLFIKSVTDDRVNFQIYHHNPHLHYSERQQIQQMNIPEEDNGISIFDQLKHMFFEDDPEHQQIVRLIRQEPILHVNRMLLILTQEYSRKLDEIVQPLQEERNHLAVTLMEQRERLHNCLEDNEYFKNIIDQLEEDRKDVQARLDKTLEEKESSRMQAILQIGESEKLKHEAGKLYVNYQQIYDQNIKFKEINFKLETDLNILKTNNLILKTDNEKCLANNLEITNKFHLLSGQLQKQRDESNNLRQKIVQKQEFIASFVEEYNNFHFFSQQEERDEQEIVEIKGDEKWAGKNELKQFNFNSFIDQEVHSQKQSNEASSTRKLSTQMDSTSKHEQQQLNIKFQTPTGFKKSRANMRKPSGFGSNQIQIKDKYGSSVRSCMNKAISWRNLHENKTTKVPQYPQEEERMMETVLRNKINQKNQKIIDLQNEMMHLRIEFIEQRENITVMEGEYELQIDQLNRQIIFIKQQLGITQQRQLLARIQSEAYFEKNRQLEDQLQTMKEEHKTYRQQLKIKCKAFVIERMNQIQRHQERLSMQTAHITNEPHNINPIINNKKQINTGLHFQHEEEKDQIISFSEIQSFHQLPSHYINTASFDLNLSQSKVIEPKHEERGSSEMFQIQSDLGNFTERMQEQSRQNIQGNFTERAIQISLHNQHKQINNQIHSNLYEIIIGTKTKQMTVQQQPQIQILASIKQHNFNITQHVTQVYMPISKVTNLKINSTIETVMLIPRSKIYTITKTLQTKIIANRKERNQIKPNLKIDLQIVKKRNHKLRSQLAKFNYIPQTKTHLLAREWTEFMSVQNENRKTNDYQADQQKYLQTSPSTASFIGIFLHRLSISNTVDILIDKEVKIFNQNIQQESTHRQVSRSRASTFNTACQIPKIPMPISPRADLFGKGIRQSHQDIMQTSNIWSEEGVQPSKLQGNYFNFPQRTFSFKNDELSQTDKNQTHQTAMKQTVDNIPNLDNTKTIKKSNSPQSISQQRNNKEDIKLEQMNIPCLKLSFHDSPDTSFQHVHPINRSELKQSLSLSLCSQKQQFSFSFEHCMKDDRKGLQTERSLVTPNFTSIEINTKLTADQNALLNKYLQNHKLSLKYQKIVGKNNFKKPNELDKKIIIVSGRSNNELQTFLLNSYQIYSLESGRNIKFEKSKYINQNNFMFGQSEVIVTGNGHLVVNRNGKKKKLTGNLEDGDWLIDSYIVCGYSTIV